MTFRKLSDIGLELPEDTRTVCDDMVNDKGDNVYEVSCSYTGRVVELIATDGGEVVDFRCQSLSGTQCIADRTKKCVLLSLKSKKED